MSGLLLTFDGGQAITSEDARSAPSGQRTGILLTQDYDGDPVHQAETVTCCHCGRMWVWQRGSGKLRGHCRLCNGITCGPHCSRKCRPVEQLLENMEAGRDLDYTPIRISVPGGVPT